MTRTLPSRAAAFALTVGLALAAGAASGQTAYKLPPKAVVDLVDAPLPAQAVVSPTGDAVLLVDPEAYPPIAVLAEPMLRLAGVRITPATGCRQRTLRYTGVSVAVCFSGGDGEAHRAAAPRRGSASRWGRTTGAAWERPRLGGWRRAMGRRRRPRLAQAVAGVRLNDVLGAPFAWEGDALLVRSVPPGRGAGAARAPRFPSGRIVEETAGKASRMATYQDLLRDAHDEALFEHYARASWRASTPRTGSGEAGRRAGALHRRRASPDGRYLLVHLSQAVLDPRAVRLLRARGRGVGRLREAGATGRRPAGSDDVAAQGVPTARAMSRGSRCAGHVVWAEALDGGDPRARSPHRDQSDGLGRRSPGSRRAAAR